ncbi:MAG: virulence RhuM family protein [Actinomycetales bacterium]|nr:virulence RhuM family protein [Actinomycetales bacterium]
MDAPTLAGAGSVSHRQAVTHAEGEYAKFLEGGDAAPSDVEQTYLNAIKEAQRGIEGRK